MISESIDSIINRIQEGTLVQVANSITEDMKGYCDKKDGSQLKIVVQMDEQVIVFDIKTNEIEGINDNNSLIFQSNEINRRYIESGDSEYNLYVNKLKEKGIWIEGYKYNPWNRLLKQNDS